MTAARRSRKSAADKRDAAELQRVRKLSIARVADVPLRARVAPTARHLDGWLEELALLSSAYIRNDPHRPGGLSLMEVVDRVDEVRVAIAAGNASVAVWAGMRAMHAAWLAQSLDAEKIIKAGVKRASGARTKNTEREQIAASQDESWRQQAAEIWKQNPRLSKSDVAKQIDSRRWNTIRQRI